MQVSGRFTMAVHMFACMGVNTDKKITSEFLAQSIGTNPVSVRKLEQRLKNAGLLDIVRGAGGVRPSRPLEHITLLDIYLATEDTENGMFAFGDNLNTESAVGKGIHTALDDRLLWAEKVFESELSGTTMADVVKDIRKNM